MLIYKKRDWGSVSGHKLSWTCEKRKERQRGRLGNGGWKAHKITNWRTHIHIHKIYHGSRLVLYNVLLCENPKF